MNKYKRMFMQKESMSKFINDFELSLLLFDFKLCLNKGHDFVKFKELSNFKQVL